MKPSKKPIAATALRKLTPLLLAGALAACGAAEPPKVDLKVENWGPQTTQATIVPNAQADGGAGIWIQVTGAEALGAAQVTFGGEPAVTVVQPKVITASIPAKNFAQPGSKEIAIKQVSTGKVFPVGTFKIEPGK